MRKTVGLILVLTALCVVSGSLRALTNNAAPASMDQAPKARSVEALKKVLPDCDNDLSADARVVKDDGREWTFYVARKAGALVGVAFRSEVHGYGGPIQILVGVLPDGTLNAVEVLAADSETPGLGAKVRDHGFLDQFRGRRAADTRWAAVRQDGGEIHAVTGATISSRAVTRAVGAGLDVYTKHLAEVREKTPRK